MPRIGQNFRAGRLTTARRSDKISLIVRDSDRYSEGVIDWRHVFDRLRQAGFDGCVVLHSLEEADVRTAVRFLARCMAGEVG